MPRNALLCLCVILSTAHIGFVHSTSLGLVSISDTDTLNKGQTINAPGQLVAGNGQVRLQIQGDGNLVIVQNTSQILWASNTSGCQPDGQCHLVLRDDGDVAYYGCPTCGKVLWETKTAGSSGNKFVMQSDCNLVLYDSSNKVLWASNTGCKGPPPPSPGPPTPPPGPLPPLPDKLWFGWWGGTTDAYNFTSLFIDSPEFEDDSHIQQYGGPSLRFLYPAYMFFCQEQQMSGNCTLFPDYQNRWNAAIPKMQDYLKSQKILGFNVGDERICGNDKHGTSIDDWNTIINTMRTSFPRGQAIIYTNECGSTFDDNTLKSIPSGLDWIGVDKYYTDSKTEGFITKVVKPYYEKQIFPKLHSYQKVAITPQVTDCKNLHKNEIGDGNDAIAWAKKESRIAFILPYRFDDLQTNCNGGDLYNFWVNFGKSTK
eukprot:m.134964 g.134964  ORF g.134964 m.134964 type:complete len:427 (+) comp14707_c0_seq5:2878-4158(+)